MEGVKVFGFGSFFAQFPILPRDIDLLVIHRSMDKQSCGFAIACKYLILQALPTADVVLLSEQEAEGNKFIARSGAVPLGYIWEEGIDEQIKALVNVIHAY